jgi:hypothetical protein
MTSSELFYIESFNIFDIENKLLGQVAVGNLTDPRPRPRLKKHPKNNLLPNNEYVKPRSGARLEELGKKETTDQSDIKKKVQFVSNSYSRFIGPQHPAITDFGSYLANFETLGAYYNPWSSCRNNGKSIVSPQIVPSIIEMGEPEVKSETEDNHSTVSGHPVEYDFKFDQHPKSWMKSLPKPTVINPAVFGDADESDWSDSESDQESEEEEEEVRPTKQMKPSPALPLSIPKIKKEKLIVKKEEEEETDSFPEFGACMDIVDLSAPKPELKKKVLLPKKQKKIIEISRTSKKKIILEDDSRSSELRGPIECFYSSEKTEDYDEQLNEACKKLKRKNPMDHFQQIYSLLYGNTKPLQKDEDSDDEVITFKIKSTRKPVKVNKNL